jgi:hypothetical protein
MGVINRVASIMGEILGFLTIDSYKMGIMGFE